MITWLFCQCFRIPSDQSCPRIRKFQVARPVYFFLQRLSQDALAQSLLRENTIIELDALSQADKKFLVPMICLWLYHLQLSDPVREKLRLVIFVEEAHHLLHRSDGRANETMMEMLLRQCREVGIAIVVIDQMPHTVSNAVLANVYTTVLMNMTNPSDMNKAAAISRMDEENKSCFSSLPVGHAVIKLQDRWTEAFLVQFPLVQVKKGSVTDSALGRLIRRNSMGTPPKRGLVQEFGGVSRGPMWDEVLSGVALQFLEDVVLYEDDGVKKRYGRLGLPANLDIVVTHFDSNALGENAYVDFTVFESDLDIWSCHVLYQPSSADKG